MRFARHANSRLVLRRSGRPRQHSRDGSIAECHRMASALSLNLTTYPPLQHLPGRSVLSVARTTIRTTSTFSGRSERTVRFSIHNPQVRRSRWRHRIPARQSHAGDRITVDCNAPRRGQCSKPASKHINTDCTEKQAFGRTSSISPGWYLRGSNAIRNSSVRHGTLKLSSQPTLVQSNAWSCFSLLAAASGATLKSSSASGLHVLQPNAEGFSKPGWGAAHRPPGRLAYV